MWFRKFSRKAAVTRGVERGSAIVCWVEFVVCEVVDEGRFGVGLRG